MIKLHSQDVPPADRFDWWRSLVDEVFVPSEITSPMVDDFPVAVTLIPLGPVVVSILTLPSLRSVRTWRTIRRADPELWQIGVVTRGGLGIEQHRSRTLLRAGDLVTYDTSYPFESWVGEDWPACAVQLHLPKDQLPIRDRALYGLAGGGWSARSGTGAVLGGFLEQIAAQAGTWDADEAERLGSAAIDLSVAFLSGLARQEDTLDPQIRRSALLHQVKRFIGDNLADRRLSPAAVAAAHHISVRYLHQLFTAEEHTVAAYIRARRLERCRTDLAGSRLPVAAVGARWGFADPAVFSRVFKAAYGMPPGEYRRQHGGTGRSSAEQHSHPRIPLISPGNGR